MSHPKKQKLLQEFADYLEKTEFAESDPSQPALAPDLNSLLIEMTCLKTEVKAESRYLKSMLEQYSVSLETLQHDNKALIEQLEQSQQRLAEQKRETQTATQHEMVLDFLDVYDRLVAAAAVLNQYKPVASLFNHSTKQDRRFIKSMHEGNVMSIKRMEQLLMTYQVDAIDTEGKTLDPHTMTAVATANKKNLPQGQVVEEMRKGFYFKQNVLRLAEVKVNKITG